MRGTGPVLRGRIIGEQRQRRAAIPDLAAIEDDLRALAEDHGHGRISRAEWMAARQPLEERLRAAQAALEADTHAAALTDIDVNLRERWPILDVDRQRTIIAAVFEAIYIKPSTRRGGPAPMVEGIGRIDLDRVEVVWRA